MDLSLMNHRFGPQRLVNMKFCNWCSRVYWLFFLNLAIFFLLVRFDCFSNNIDTSFLSLWTVIQGVFSRPNRFDGVFPVITVNLIPQFSPPGLWLNVEVTIGLEFLLVIWCLLSMFFVLNNVRSRTESGILTNWPYFVPMLPQHDVFFTQRNLSMRS